MEGKWGGNLSTPSPLSQPLAGPTLEGPLPAAARAAATARRTFLAIFCCFSLLNEPKKGMSGERGKLPKLFSGQLPADRCWPTQLLGGEAPDLDRPVGWGQCFLLGVQMQIGIVLSIGWLLVWHGGIAPFVPPEHSAPCLKWKAPFRLSQMLPAIASFNCKLASRLRAVEAREGREPPSPAFSV